MKTALPEDWLRQRAELAETIEEDAVDVADQVLSTLANSDSIGLAVDKTPLILGGGLLALAASIMLLLLPSLTTMTEPWISFWLV